MIELRASNVIFYSQLDEDNFINWIESLESVVESYGEISDFVIIVKDNLSDDDVREIIAFFFRYDVSMKQLKIFHDSHDMKWMNNKKMFWYDKVFNGS